MRRPSLLLALALQLFALPAAGQPSAPAPSVGEVHAPALNQGARAPELLTLRTGRVLRVRVVSVAPEQGVTYDAGDGVLRTLPWSELDPSGAAWYAPRARASDPTELREPLPGRTRFDFRSLGQQQQLRAYFDGDSFEVHQGDNVEALLLARSRPLCTTPCTAYLPLGPFRFFSTGSEVVTGFFRFEVTREEQTVWLRAPSARGNAVGLTLAVFGALGAFAGGALTIAGAVRHGDPVLLGPGLALLPLGALSFGFGVARTRANLPGFSLRPLGEQAPEGSLPPSP